MPSFEPRQSSAARRERKLSATSQPTPAEPAGALVEFLALQRTLGNRVAQRLLPPRAGGPVEAAVSLQEGPEAERVRYEPGEVAASRTSRMVVEKLPLSVDAWAIYDFAVGSAAIDAARLDPELIASILRALGTPATAERQRPGAGSPGGLLTPPQRLPQVVVIGGSDRVGTRERNRQLRRQRAENFVQTFFPSELRSRTRRFDMVPEYAWFPNDSRYDRARNRNVVIVNLGPRLWTVEEQKEQASRESGTIFRQAIRLLETRPGTWGPKAAEDRATAMLRLLLDTSVDDRYYTAQGVNNYIQNGSYQRGILPGSELSGVGHARAELIRWIVDVSSIEAFVRAAHGVSEAMNGGWFRAETHPLRLADISAKKLHEWVSDEQANPKSVNHVARLTQ